MVAFAGAGPWPQITSVWPRLVSCTMIGTSPPGPFKCGSTTCIEGVAALFQNTHADGSRDPVGGGDHAKSAFDFRPGGEWIGIDVAHGNPMRCWYRDAGALDHRQSWMPTAGMPRIAPISVIIPRRRLQPDG